MNIFIYSKYIYSLKKVYVENIYMYLHIHTCSCLHTPILKHIQYCKYAQTCKCNNNNNRYVLLYELLALTKHGVLS